MANSNRAACFHGWLKTIGVRWHEPQSPPATYQISSPIQGSPYERPFLWVWFPCQNLFQFFFISAVRLKVQLPFSICLRAVNDEVAFGSQLINLNNAKYRGPKSKACCRTLPYLDTIKGPISNPNVTLFSGIWTFGLQTLLHKRSQRSREQEATSCFKTFAML